MRLLTNWSFGAIGLLVYWPIGPLALFSIGIQTTLNHAPHPNMTFVLASPSCRITHSAAQLVAHGYFPEAPLLHPYTLSALRGGPCSSRGDPFISPFAASRLRSSCHTKERTASTMLFNTSICPQHHHQGFNFARRTRYHGGVSAYSAYLPVMPVPRQHGTSRSKTKMLMGNNACGTPWCPNTGVE